MQIAAITTCHASLKLYSLLEMLDRRVLYYDTDSVIFVSRPGDADPETVSFLGDLTDELKKPGDYITEFVSGGPKIYAFKTRLGEHVCKVKGFSFNHKNSKLINFEPMLGLVSRPQNQKDKKRKRSNKQAEEDVDKIVVTNDRKITRQKLKRKIYNRKEKKNYRIVYDKRVLQKDSFDTLPYGY